MEEKEAGAFIVLSDTHLGLREYKRLHFFKNTVAHRPTHVDQFVKWLEFLQSKREIELPVAIEELHGGEYEIKEISSRKISSPDMLILNGDIFELWDASDQSVLFSSHSILNSISKLASEKIYLIGNHDYANAELTTGEEGIVAVPSNLFPWGLSNVKVFRNTYPTPKDGKIRTLRIGEDHYLLIHGHQFFGSTPWEIISLIRDGAEAFRLYSWVLVGLWMIWIGSLTLSAFLELGISPSIMYLIAIPLTVLAFPRIFASIARPIWNKFFGTRYDRTKAPKGFVKWWKKFSTKNELEAKRIHVLYGHTHAIDIVGKNELEKMVKNNIGEVDLKLINHPAWVKDSNKHKNEIQEVFVYVDKCGPEFFGWSWDTKSPFHIPKSVIRTYVSGQKIDDKTAELLLNKLYWPKGLIDELIVSGSISKRVTT